MDDTSTDGRIAALVNRLEQAASATGGWGYYPARASRIESTCWALIALRGAWRGSIEAWRTLAQPHLRFLQSCQRPDGLLTDLPTGPTNLTTDGLAAVTLAALFPEARPTLTALLAGVIGQKGLSLTGPGFRPNEALQAWPWYPDTYSWVEPTAWCLLALKKAPDVVDRTAADARIAEAERVMEDRCCADGGWNYGNGSVLGQDLRPYVPTSALGLLALQDRLQRPFVAKSVVYLEGARMKESSSIALGLAALSLHVCGRDTNELVSPLMQSSLFSESRGQVVAMAIALAALTLSAHDAKVFRVAI